MAAPLPDQGAIVAAKYGIARSPRWPAVEKVHLASQPQCVCCEPGQSPTAGLQVHHIFPFHYCIALGRPDLELDPRNLITLCEDEDGRQGQDHHLLVGHLDDFESSNLQVVTDAENTFLGMEAAAIRADATWKAKVAARLKPLGEMTAPDKDQFVAEMNARFPR